MQISPVKAGITAMLVIGLVGFLYWVTSAMGKSETGALDSYGRGEMHSFVTLSDAPAQPALAFTDAEGGEHHLSDYRGKVILVNLWATWCGPCVEEMPALNRLQQEFGGENFDVVTISFDRTFEPIAEFFEREQIDSLPVLRDASFSSLNLVGALGLPMSILYDGYGREIGRLPAPADWDSDEAHALIRAAINRG
ncbi:TlpA disulfide reductase family protein [uncultured Maricaulis sp.]|uniref:TlpA family protein disulfide reductase n=1 Tax=uncultured Maricaulis sp. TaxID=174710 RepID=UPI0030D8DC9A|tara:strand:+ start:186883 stop:187467 length:585 start_codon:yes stop_codon:yes gene_type:complete